jgi:prevent-host-death family protein
MKILNAKDAKYGFGRLIDMARAEPVLVAKHGRPVVVVLSVEEYQRLKSSKDKNLTKSNTARPTSTEEN